MTTTTPPRTASGFTHERSRGKSCEHYTPGWLLDALGASFDLDPHADLSRAARHGLGDLLTTGRRCRPSTVRALRAA